MPAKGRTVANSKLIAGFIGPLLVAMGVAMLLNRDLFSTMIEQFAQNYGLIFLSGILSLLAGVAIVRVHNVWTADGASSSPSSAGLPSSAGSPGCGSRRWPPRSPRRSEAIQWLSSREASSS